jgi:hypothetical protein
VQVRVDDDAIEQPARARGVVVDAQAMTYSRMKEACSTRT